VSSLCFTVSFDGAANVFSGLGVNIIKLFSSSDASDKAGKSYGRERLCAVDLLVLTSLNKLLLN
jgi:hypothetical protein